MWTFNSVSNNFRINVNLAKVFASRNYFSAISFFSVLLLTSSNISTMKLLKQPFAWNHHYSKSLAIIKPFHAILAFLDLCWNNHKSNAKIMKHIFPDFDKTMEFMYQISHKWTFFSTPSEHLLAQSQQ